MIRPIFAPLLAALTFYTRLPVPSRWHLWVTPEALRKSSVWLPMIGLLVGSLAASVLILSRPLFGDLLAAILTVGASMLITGGFHEDGLADMADGFGGGWTRDDILRIMKDPTHGTYGVLTVMVITMLKIAALLRISPELAPVALISSHTAARSLAVTFLATHTYARSEGKGQKAIATLPRGQVLVCLAIGLGAVLPFGWQTMAIIAVSLASVRTYFARLFTQKLQGYTGDCLGAVEQVGEVVILLAIAAISPP